MNDFFPQFAQQLVNGLTLGAIYALIAIGYSMVYGIIGMINFAHGEIYMLGAYVGLVTLTAIGTSAGYPLPVVLGAALVVSSSSPGSTGSRSSASRTGRCAAARGSCRSSPRSACRFFFRTTYRSARARATCRCPC